MPSSCDEARGRVVEIGPREVCKIAGASDTDHRTVERFLAGDEPKRYSRARERIIEAMYSLGYAEHIPDSVGSPDDREP
jgi:hypothetical protein